MKKEAKAASDASAGEKQAEGATAADDEPATAESGDEKQ
jgi:hypothetical protein